MSPSRLRTRRSARAGPGPRYAWNRVARSRGRAGSPSTRVPSVRGAPTASPGRRTLRPASPHSPAKWAPSVRRPSSASADTSRPARHTGLPYFAPRRLAPWAPRDPAGGPGRGSLCCFTCLPSSHRGGPAPGRVQTGWRSLRPTEAAVAPGPPSGPLTRGSGVADLSRGTRATGLADPGWLLLSPARPGRGSGSSGGWGP